MKKPGAYDKNGNLVCELTREEVEADRDWKTIFSAKGIPSEEQYRITKVVIPERTTKIGICAFRNCKSLISVEIPNSVTMIRSIAFYGCTSLFDISLPNSIVSIEGGAFYNCTFLKSLTKISVKPLALAMGI